MDRLNLPKAKQDIPLKLINKSIHTIHIKYAKKIKTGNKNSERQCLMDNNNAINNGDECTHILSSDGQLYNNNISRHFRYNL